MFRVTISTCHRSHNGINLIVRNNAVLCCCLREVSNTIDWGSEMDYILATFVQPTNIKVLEVANDISVLLLNTLSNLTFAIENCMVFRVTMSMKYSSRNGTNLSIKNNTIYSFVINVIV